MLNASMHQRRLAKLLLHPSLFSSVVTTILAIVILTVAIWPYAIKSPLISPFFNGPYGISATVKQSADIANFTAAFSVSPIVYNLLILGVAALIAGGVYALLQSFSKIVVGSYDTWHAIHDAGAAANTVEKEIGARVTVRILAVLLWIAFIFFFVNLLLPYCIYITRVGIDNLLNWSGLYGLAGYALLLVSMHLHVIFLRLIMLRPRVFGGKLDIQTAIYEADENKD